MYAYLCISPRTFFVMQVPGTFKLKGHERLRRLSELYAEGIQFMPHQRRDVTYVSRLQVNMGITIITVCMLRWHAILYFQDQQTWNPS